MTANSVHDRSQIMMAVAVNVPRKTYPRLS